MFGSKDVEDITLSGVKPFLLQQLYYVKSDFSILLAFLVNVRSRHDAYMRQVLREVYSSGCSCIVLTVDCPVLGNREHDQEQNKWESSMQTCFCKCISFVASPRFDFSEGDVRLAFTKEKYWKGAIGSIEEMYKVGWTAGEKFNWNLISWFKSIVDVKVILKVRLRSFLCSLPY